MSLLGSGFDPLATYVVRVSGVEAAIEEIQPTFVRFTVPTGVATGPVTLEIAPDGPTLQYPLPLSVVRSLDASFGAVPMATAGHGFGTAFGDSVSTQAPFALKVARGAPTPIAAAKTANEPSLLAIALDSTVSAELTAASTAQALVFTTPYLYTEEPGQAAARLSLIAVLPETQALATAIESSLAAGQNYLDDPAFGDAFAVAVGAALEASGALPPPPAPAAALGDDFSGRNYDFAPGYPRKLGSPPPFQNLPFLEISASPFPGINPRGLPTLGVLVQEATAFKLLGFYRVTSNPVDWIASLYELDPSQFPGGRADVDELEDDFQTAWDRLQAEPLGRLAVPAAPLIDNFDLPKAFARFVVDQLFKRADRLLVSGNTLPTDEGLRFQSDRPALYMLRAFSGVPFSPQDPLLDALPGGRQEQSRALTLNVTLAALDVSGIVGKAIAGLSEREFAEILVDTAVQVSQAVQRAQLSGNLDKGMVGLILREAAKGLIEATADKLKEKGLHRLATGMFDRRRANVVVKVYELVTSGLRVAERVAALTDRAGGLDFAQAVESAAVIVGDPWKPEVTSFSPLRAHRGVRGRINGRNLSNDDDDTQVEFNASVSTDPDPPVAAPADVIHQSWSALEVAVPEAAADGLGPIRVRVPGFGNAYTALNAPPFQQFEVIPDPVITGIDPPSPAVGRPMRIIGQNFARQPSRNSVRMQVGGLQTGAVVLASTETDLVVLAPTTAVPSSVQVVISEPVQNLERTSNAVPFTPVAGSGEAGCTLRIASTADDVIADGVITLREAIYFVSATPFRPPTEAELGWVSDAPCGQGLADRVELFGLPSGSVFALSSALGSLPPVDSFDTYDLGGAVIDGTDVGGNGLTAAGTSFLDLYNFTLRGFSGDGVVLQDATAVQVRVVRVEDCGQSGIHLTGSSTSNSLQSVSVVSCDGHGVWFDGPLLLANECRFPWYTQYFPGDVLDNGGYGVLASGGAAFNLLSCARVRSNTLGGIAILDASSVGNSVGIVEPVAVVAPVEVSGNAGPGVMTQAGSTHVRLVASHGNTGDGILVEGADNRGSMVDSVTVGVDAAGALSPNTGAGIHLRANVSEAQLGLPATIGMNEPPASVIAGNLGHGIWLEGAGVHDVEVGHARIGATFQPAAMPLPPFLPQILPNGLSGIALTDGTHDNDFGNFDEFYANEIVGHTNGAGVLIEGADTRGNRVFANRIGLVGHDPFFGDVLWPDLGNLRGVHVRNGAYANVIGDVGDDLVQGLPPLQRITRSRNLIASSTEAGVLLESGCQPGGTTTGGTPPTGCNVVQNNTIGVTSPFFPTAGNRVGVLLRGGARANRVGGAAPGEGNTIRASAKAGIHVDGVQIPSPKQANRILGNQVIGHGGLPVPGEPLLLQGPPDGVGILVGNGASGEVIGSERPGEGNLIHGTRVGVYLDGVSGVHVRHNRIGSAALGAGNEIAGAILRGCTRCTLGPGNEIAGNARVALGLAKLGGVTVAGGSGNRIVGNWIGTEPSEQILSGNDPWGVRILDSADNEVGGAALDDGNAIVASIADGVRIEGAQSARNGLGRNHIGVRTNGALAANLGAGVRILAGAHDSHVGDRMPLAVQNAVAAVPAPNTIAANAGGGLVVNGAASVGNRIQFNSITGHPGLGIDNQAGGNTELPPPVIASVTGGIVSGNVDASVPDGSLVQVFSDPADEGQTYLAQGLTASRAFGIALPQPVPPGMLTATVTHAADGSTSEFSSPVPPPPPGLVVLLDTAVQIDPAANAGDPDVPVLPLRVTAVGMPVRVLSLRFDASGTLVDAAHVSSVRLFHDADRDGAVSPGDVQLGGLAGFDSDDGQATLPLTGALLGPDEPRTWLLVYSLAGTAPGGATFSARVDGAASVAAEVALASGVPVGAGGVFPVASAEIEVAFPDSDGDGTGDDADNCPYYADPDQGDVDGDGRGNVCECTDQNGDGRNNVRDLIAINAAIFYPFLATPLCDGNGDGLCNVSDLVAANREIFSPGSTSICGRQPVPGP